MKILNLYAGIGGNRKLWPKENEITAVEINKDIAAIYKDLYPNDKVIIADAHQYLLDHYKEFDFIWSSPPCPSHSITNHFLNARGVIRYPDLKLYEEIILLTNFYKGKYVIENVKSYYTPLIEPQKSGRHYFWSNFNIPAVEYKKQIGRMNGKKKDMGKAQVVLRSKNLKKLNIDLSKYSYKDKDRLLRNCVAPKIGLAIYNKAFNIIEESNRKQLDIFSNE